MDIARKPSEAGFRHINAAIAGDGVGLGAERHMAKRLHLLQLAGGAKRIGGRGGGRRRGGWFAAGRGRIAGRGVGHQRVRGDPARVVGQRHRVAACHRHMFLRPVFQRVAGGQHLRRGGQLDGAARHHQHRLIDVVYRSVADHLVGRGENPDVAEGFDLIDFAAAGIGRTR